MFSRYHLTEQEALVALNLSELTRAWLQNELSVAAESRVQLEVTVKDINSFVQADAEAKAKVIFIQYVLALSERARDVLLQQAIGDPDDVS